MKMNEQLLYIIMVITRQRNSKINKSQFGLMCV